MIRKPQDIEKIIHSFKHYALGDIKHNENYPIASFILSMCFLDQLAYFRYFLTIKKSNRTNTFIDKYMPEYKKLKLYTLSRNSLVHNYSSDGKFDIDHRGNENVPYNNKDGVIHINTKVFTMYLEKAFEDVVEDFRVVGSDAYENALKASIKYPVLVDTYK